MATEPLLRLEQIAAELQVHVVSIRRWIRSGELKATMASRGTGYRVNRKDLDDFMRRRQQPLSAA